MFARVVVACAFFFSFSAFADGADPSRPSAPTEEATDTVDDDPPPVAKPPPPPPLESVALAPGPTASDLAVPFIKTMLMLGVVLLLVWLTLAKGMGKLVEKAQAGKRVKVIERVALDARRSLFLIEVDGKQMLVGGGDVVRVADLDPSAPQQKLERQGLFEKILTQTKKPEETSTTTTEPTA